MAYEMKDNSFTIFKNKKKVSDKQPDYRGEIKINGEVMDLSAWVKESKTGEKYFSGVVSEKYQAPAAKPSPKITPESVDSEDLPF